MVYNPWDRGDDCIAEFFNSWSAVNNPLGKVMPRVSPASQKNYYFLALRKDLFKGCFFPHGVHGQGLSSIPRQSVLYWLRVAATWPTEVLSCCWVTGS